MVRKLQIIASSALALALTFIATTSANSLKWVILYEPEVPEALRREK